MKKFLAAALVILALTIGCKIEPPKTSENAPSPSPSPSPSSTTVASQLTLPVLDALLTNDSFVTELKSKMMLSDDQIAQLKKLSSESVAELRKGNVESGSSEAANAADTREKAGREIAGVLGGDKAKQLDDLARDFWAKGGEQADTSKPEAAPVTKALNAVPSDTRIVVNAPAFRMDLFRDGSIVKSYKIGIGYPEFPLPQGLREAKIIIFNPTWTPPDSPWVANMKNVSAGEVVEAGSALNPLGPIKIPIGLPSLIHGGKAQAKLGQFASHGCVGLTNAQVKDFAKQLARASGTEVSDKTIASYLADKTKTRVVKLNQTVPVELRYETIVVEGGKLHIFKDVYEQNTNTEGNLKAVLEANGSRLEDLTADEQTKALEALNAMSAHPKKIAKPSPTVSESPSANDNRRTKTTAKAPVKNQKEIVIDVAALSGRGYPEPVDLDIGNGKSVEKTAATATPKRPVQ
jgi:L,D-transpeptidase ErfK/SrfK